jgi:hypothetical protein
MITEPLTDAELDAGLHAATAPDATAWDTFRWLRDHGRRAITEIRSLRISIASLQDADEGASARHVAQHAEIERLRTRLATTSQEYRTSYDTVRASLEAVAKERDEARADLRAHREALDLCKEERAVFQATAATAADNERHAICDALGIDNDDDAANPAGVALRVVRERDEALAIAERRRLDQAAALDVKTVEGLTASEWLMRTALAERARDAAIARAEAAESELARRRVPDACPRNECQIRKTCTRPTVCLAPAPALPDAREWSSDDGPIARIVNRPSDAPAPAPLTVLAALADPRVRSGEMDLQNVDRSTRIIWRVVGQQVVWSADGIEWKKQPLVVALADEPCTLIDAATGEAVAP